jgi:hypothetical protein
MTAIYTKDGLTVHFSSKHPAEIEYTLHSMLTTVCLAIENAPSGISERDKGSISQVVRMVSEMLPLESDFELMLAGNKDSLQSVSDTLLA